MPTRSLSLLAYMFALLFATLVVAAILPFKPFDPLWQLRMCGALLRNASLALIAVALIELSAFLDPEDPVLEERQRRFSRIAAAACLGFLLLIPLQITASVTQLRSLSGSEGSRLRATEGKLIRLRQAVRSASSYEDLKAKFQVLQGPTLGPVSDALPLDRIKAQVNNSLDQSQSQITRKRAALNNISPVRLAPDLLRDSVASLLLAFGFALFGRLPDSEVSLIEAIQLRLHQRSVLRSRETAALEEEELLRQIELEDLERMEEEERALAAQADRSEQG